MARFSFCPRCGSKLADRGRDGEPDRVDRACPDAACGFVHYDNPTPVVAALVEAPDATAVLVRNHGWPDTWFGLVSGFLEKEEAPADAILREIREELGAEGSLVGLIGEYSFAQMNQVISVFHVRIDTTEVVAGGDVAATKRVPLAKLRPWPMGTGHAVADWLAANRRPLEIPGAPDSVGFLEGWAPFSIQQIAELYRAVGWARHADQPTTLRDALDGSSLVVTAFDADSGEPVGLLRAISDGAWIAYLQEVLVAPSHQRRGIGRALMQAFLDRYDGLRQKVLLTDNSPEQHAFYESTGFVDLHKSSPELHAFARMSGLESID